MYDRMEYAMKLGFLHQKRIAVAVQQGKTQLLLTGTGRYQRVDDDLAELVVNLDETGGQAESTARIIFSEKEWNGEVLEHGHCGCDYRIELLLT